MSSRAGEFAALQGHLLVLKYLRKLVPPCPLDFKTCNAASRGNQFEILKWLRKKGCQMNENVCENAAENGNLEMVKWTLDFFPKLENNTKLTMLEMAAKSGNIELLLWMQENKLKWNESVCSAAAASGKLEALKFLRDKNCPWDGQTFYSAAAAGHWDILYYCEEQNCKKITSGLMAAVAKTGNLEILQWLHEVKGCKLEPQVVLSAISGGSLECLEYAISHGCPIPKGFNVILPAASACFAHIIKWILSQKLGNPDKAIIIEATRQGNINVLLMDEIQHLYDDSVTSEVAKIAASNGHLEILCWLHRKGYFWDKEICFQIAKQSKVKNVANWIHPNLPTVIEEGKKSPQPENDCVVQ